MPVLVTIPGTQLVKYEFDRAFDAARRYARHSRARDTWLAYRSDWQQFESWCGTTGLAILPAGPDTVAMFVASQAASGLGTMTRQRSAIDLGCERTFY